MYLCPCLYRLRQDALLWSSAMDILTVFSSVFVLSLSLFLFIKLKFPSYCLRSKSFSADRTIIFVPLFQFSGRGDLYLYFKEALGHSFLHPKDAPDKSK